MYEVDKGSFYHHAISLKYLEKKYSSLEKNYG